MGMINDNTYQNETGSENYHDNRYIGSKIEITKTSLLNLLKWHHKKPNNLKIRKQNMFWNKIFVSYLLLYLQNPMCLWHTSQYSSKHKI